MHWGLRIATDRNAGLGHAVRCHALACAHGGAVTVFVDPDKAGVERTGLWPGEIVQEASREGAGLARHALETGDIDALVFDSYWVSEAEISSASQTGCTAVIRDGSSYGAETVTIDPRPGAIEGLHHLAGPSYMPLPERFADLHTAAIQREAENTRELRILVTFGQRDSNERTLCVVKGLLQVSGLYRAKIVVGQDYNGEEEVQEAVSSDTRLQLVRNPDDLPAMFDQFDLSIGAPGVSQYERACCGLPTMLVAQNERQEQLVSAWAASGAAIGVPAQASCIAAGIESLDKDRARLAAIRRAGLDCVDGRGAQRLAHDLNEHLKVPAS